MNVLDRVGFAFNRDCCSSTFDLSWSSSYKVLVSLPAPSVDDTALAIAIAADEDTPPEAVGAKASACIALLRASLIASASARACDADVKEKTCASGAGALGGCAKILSMTFGLLAGVCCRSSY